jgi:hypothetical protein
MTGSSVTTYNRHLFCGRERAFEGKGSFHGLCRDLTVEVGEHAPLAFGAFVGIYQMSLNWIRFRQARNTYEECNKNRSVQVLFKDRNLSKTSFYSRESSLYIYILISLHYIQSLFIYFHPSLVITVHSNSPFLSLLLYFSS